MQHRLQLSFVPAYTLFNKRADQSYTCMRILLIKELLPQPVPGGKYIQVGTGIGKLMRINTENGSQRMRIKVDTDTPEFPGRCYGRIFRGLSVQVQGRKDLIALAGMSISRMVKDDPGKTIGYGDKVPGACAWFIAFQRPEILNILPEGRSWL